jgi:hypothetical protein
MVEIMQPIWTLSMCVNVLDIYDWYYWYYDGIWTQIERYGPYAAVYVLFGTVNGRIRQSYGKNTDSRIDWPGKV